MGVCSSSLVFKDNYSDINCSFISEIEMLIFKISSLFIIELRYPEHDRVMHALRHK